MLRQFAFRRQALAILVNAIENALLQGGAIANETRSGVVGFVAKDVVPTVSVSLPTFSATAGRPFEVPISVSSLTGFDVRSFRYIWQNRIHKTNPLN